MLEVDNRGDNDFFKDLQVAVVGLGLMGGSLAMGLGGHCAQILAVDPDVRTREIAIRAGIVNQVSADPAEILPLADLVILAAPVSAILEIIPALPSLHPGSPVVIDLGSTKAKICQALGKLPGRFEVVGGHPMCGKAAGGLEHAEAGLFLDSPFAFTPLPNTTERALQCAQQLAYILGAKPVWTGPNTHDSWVAATSHLPYLLSSALSLATPPEAAQLVGPGFRSTSRLAGSPATIMLPILETNREQVLEALARFRVHLDQIEKALSTGELETLKASLDRGADQQARLAG